MTYICHFPLQSQSIYVLFEIYTLGERWAFVKVAATWADSGSTSTKMGVTGYVFSGGSVYDHRSGDDDDAPLAIYWEGDSLDPYNGHSDQDSQYHYHAVSFTSL